MDRQRGHLCVDIENVISQLTWIKIVGVGNTGVGKTCLIKNFCESKFTSGYQPTVGVDYGFKIQSVQDKDLRVHLWDLSGHHEYIDVRNELYANTDAVFIVYDVTNQASFESLDTWLREVKRYAGENPSVCLVANKVDLRQKRCVPTTLGKKWAAQHKALYFETSCSTGEGVEDMFIGLLNDVMDNRK